MDALSDSTVHTVVVMSSAQVGKTEFLNNAAGFFIDQDPSPILMLQPTIEMGQAWSKDRLAPMIRDTPALKGKVKDVRSRDSGNTLLHKTFAGGHITIAGANSAASLAARPIRILMADEVDRYPESAGTEGDPVTLATKRTTTFWNRKIALTSTPTVKGMSRIEAAYEESDQRRFHVPCPDCRHEQTLRWSNVRWPEGEPGSAEYACEECGSLWDDDARWDAVSAGRWIAEAPFQGVAGFHLSELYSPWVKLSQVVRSFLDAKDSPERLKAWTNTSLGETWEERGETVGTGRLARLIEPYGAYDLPEDVIFATAGVDTQGDRLEVEVLGWGAGERSWGIRYEVIHGDPAQPLVWTALDELLSETFATASQRLVRVLAAAIDSGGHHAEAVHRFCRDRFNRRIYAIKGQGGQGRPIWPARHSMARNRDRVFLIGVDTIKDMVHSRWLIDEGEGACRLPSDPSSGYDEVWMAQATAEERVTRYKEGRPYTVWTLQKGRRNEALDCRVYATAAMRSLPRGTQTIAPEREARTPDPVGAGVEAVKRRRGNGYLGIGGGRYV